MLAYRLVNNVSLLIPRSHCPHCTAQIAWYDNIPIFSWIFLHGKCRTCSKQISILYPFIEFLTMMVFLLLWQYGPRHYFFAYFIFFSALIVTIRTDLETMLISRFVTIFLIPVGFIMSSLELLPISPLDSLLGSIFGYLLLLTIAKIFQFLTGKNGMGQGDLDLLAFIGSFVGVIGCWLSLVIGSILGSIIGIFYLIIVQPKIAVRIPFGPFLASSAIIFVFFQDFLFRLLIAR